MNRIFTTHVGSLARPDGRLKRLFARQHGAGAGCDQDEFAASNLAEGARIAAQEPW